MSTTEVQRPMKISNTNEKQHLVTKLQTKEAEKSNNKKSSSVNISTKKNKHENESRFKFGRKRSQSFVAGNGKFFPPYKRRKKDSIIPPTKFLLGGNIHDPLNLNSLQDEEINKAMNAVTPKSSPLPTPHHRRGEIEVIIPPNLRDPLNLISCEDDAEYEQQLVSPTKKGRKSRNKKKKRNSSSGGSTKDEGADSSILGSSEVNTSSEEQQKDVVTEPPTRSSFDMETNEVGEPTGEAEMPVKEREREKKVKKSLDDAAKDLKKNRKTEHLKDKIVSPVIPQPGAWKRPPLYGHRGGGSTGGGGRNRNRRSGQQQQSQGKDARPNFREKDARFQYGNYYRYYGYRNPFHEEDLRLKCFMRRPELFHDRDVLDIGCNIGHVTLMVARDLGARSVVGIDIDRKLVDIARKNVRHYVTCKESPPGNDGPPNRFFPISMPILYGPVDVPGFTKGESPSVRNKFPHNVTFVQGNYVLESDALLAMEQPQFDVILCLSVTKWIHLNWGDAGLRQAFRRMFAQLRPGGHLILEAQSWDSYKKKKALTETIFRNFSSIEFHPHKFTQYLLSSEVGFAKCEVIDTPFHRSKGFQRPIQLFTKAETSVASSCGTPATDRVPVYAGVGSLSDEIIPGDSFSNAESTGSKVEMEDLPADLKDNLSNAESAGSKVEMSDMTETVRDSEPGSESFSQDGAGESCSGAEDLPSSKTSSNTPNS